MLASDIQQGTFKKKACAKVDSYLVFIWFSVIFVLGQGSYYAGLMDEVSGADQECLGDDENSESEDSDNIQFFVTSSDICGFYSDNQSDHSDLDISDYWYLSMFLL